MRFIKSSLCIACLFGVILGIWLGYQWGVARTRAQVVKSALPMHVLLYRTILNNEYDKAADYVGGLIMADLHQLDVVRRNWTCRIFGDPVAFESAVWKKRIKEAREISKRVSFDWVTIEEPHKTRQRYSVKD